jgi:dihydroorotate dehydrogenase electron transfer subunit
MKKIIPQDCRVTENKRLDKSGEYFSLRVTDFDAATEISPGCFVHVKTADALDPYFRRAFSVADYDPDSGQLEIIYKVVGKGTSLMARKIKGDSIDIIGPLGNRFSPIPTTKAAVIVAGGVGFPPLYFLAKHLTGNGHAGDKVLFFYGGRSKTDLVEMSRIKRLGVEFIPCTDDGSYGFHGFVTEAVNQRLTQLDKENTVVLGCGPEPMLAALQDLTMEKDFVGEVSLEAPMPCGIGVCLGCIKPTLSNPRKYVRVCYDGPVFKLGEIKI